MRISDWSSDVCSSDLAFDFGMALPQRLARLPRDQISERILLAAHDIGEAARSLHPEGQRDRKSVVKGKSVSVRVDLGGRRSIKNKDTYMHWIKYNATQ